MFDADAQLRYISIHALRKESDNTWWIRFRTIRYFNPRSP